MSDEHVFTEWGYSEDERPSPHGFKSTENAPDAEQWARENATKWHEDGGRVFRRAVSAWEVVDEAEESDTMTATDKRRQGEGPVMH